MDLPPVLTLQSTVNILECPKDFSLSLSLSLSLDDRRGANKAMIMVEEKEYYRAVKNRLRVRETVWPHRWNKKWPKFPHVLHKKVAIEVRT